jgi:hypothetical protein
MTIWHALARWWRPAPPAPPDEGAIVWSAVNLPPGTYTRAPDGTWVAVPPDQPRDPAAWSVTVRRE